MTRIPVSELSPIYLAGPTASGKTSLSIELAHRLSAEIISVDSALIYQDMNIGTAKPSLEEREGIIHHLIDIRKPTENYSVSQFCHDAKQIVQDIQSRGKLPILVGGTMLYFKGLLEGLAQLPDRDESIRSEIEREADQFGWHQLHQQLQKLDFDTAEKISPNDPQRIQRALEVYRLTGKPISQLLAEAEHSRLDFKLIALFPNDRKWLHTRIEQRFQLMMNQDFLDEVSHLRKHYDLSIEMPSMRCVGYRQAWEYLNGEYDYNTFFDKSVAATRQLAKRQLTWLRNWKGIVRYIDPVISNTHLVADIVSELD